MSISSPEFFQKIQNSTLNTFIMVIKLWRRDICRQCPCRLSADTLSISQQTGQTYLCYVLPEDCWITLLGTLKQWWLSVLEGAKWWPSKYREKSAACCGKDLFPNLCVHSCVHKLFCVSHIELPIQWVQVAPEQHHQIAAVLLPT